jgi:hypothetical protein
MRRPLGTRLGVLTICGLIALSGSITACSDKDDGKEAGASPQLSDDEAWCDASRAVGNAVTSNLLERVEAAAEVAPSELEADYDVLIDKLRFERENPTDAVGIAERNAVLPESFVRIAVALNERCGIALEM